MDMKQAKERYEGKLVTGPSGAFRVTAMCLVKRSGVLTIEASVAAAGDIGITTNIPLVELEREYVVT